MTEVTITLNENQAAAFLKKRHLETIANNFSGESLKKIAELSVKKDIDSKLKTLLDHPLVKMNL